MKPSVLNTMDPKKGEMNVPQQISRTSRTHPLEIAEVPTGPMGAVIVIRPH